MPSPHMHLMKHSALKLKNNCICDGEPQDHSASMPCLNRDNRTPGKPYLVYTMYMSSISAALILETETPTSYKGSVYFFKAFKTYAVGYMPAISEIFKWFWGTCVSGFKCNWIVREPSLVPSLSQQSKCLIKLADRRRKASSRTVLTAYKECTDG